MYTELFRLLFTGAYPTLGEAIAAAKKATSDVDVRRSWNLLGDPATHLKGLVPRTFTNTSTRAKDLAEARRASKAAARAAQATETTEPLKTAAHDKDAKDAGDVHRASPWQASLADVNGDRRADVLLYNHDSGAMLEALSRADGTFVYHSARWIGGWNLFTADLDGDGRADMLFYDPKSGAWVEGVSDGRGGFAYRRGA